MPTLRTDRSSQSFFRQIIVELRVPQNRHYIVEIGGGTGATHCSSVPDPATDRV
jgi:hypothetical protein